MSSAPDVSASQSATPAQPRRERVALPAHQQPACPFPSPELPTTGGAGHPSSSSLGCRVVAALNSSPRIDFSRGGVGVVIASQHVPRRRFQIRAQRRRRRMAGQHSQHSFIHSLQGGKFVARVPVALASSSGEMGSSLGGFRFTGTLGSNLPAMMLTLFVVEEERKS